jgi:outer membrane protein assembly factor BamB
MLQLKNRLGLSLLALFLIVGGCKSVPVQDLDHKILFLEKTSGQYPVYLDFNDDGSKILIAPRYSTISLLNTGTGKLIGQHEFEGLIAGLTFMATNEIFIAKGDGAIELWDAELSHIKKSYSFDTQKSHAAIHDHGQWGFYGDLLFSWKDTLEVEMDLPMIGQRWLTFFGSNYAVAVGEHDSAILTVDLANMTRAEWVAPEKLRTGGPRYSSHMFILMTEDGNLYAFDVKTQEVLYKRSFFFIHPLSIVVPPHGDWFAAMYESEAVFYDAATGEKQFKLAIDFPWSGVNSSTGKLFIGAEQGSLYVFDMATREMAVARLFDQSNVGRMKWHEKTNRLAVVNEDREIMMIELQP